MADPSAPVFTCPVCSQPLAVPVEKCTYFPFCSRKCRTIDLGRWIEGDYAIPAEEIEED